MAWLLPIFILLPMAELYVLARVAGRLGFLPTLALVLVTGVVGWQMAREEGLRVLRQWQQALSENQMPADGVLSGVLVLVGGLFLVTPGLLTDMLGFLLMIPAVRRGVADRVRRALERRLLGCPPRTMEPPRKGRTRAPDVIDVEGEVIEEN